MTECIALLRGINVGRAKRIAMAQLRDLFVDLGHENVRTVLNSGNVLFRCGRANTGKLALAIHRLRAEPERRSQPAIGRQSSNCMPHRIRRHRCRCPAHSGRRSA